jgi:hypothetical protein
MDKDKPRNLEADRAALAAAAASKKIGFGGGKNFCESQREELLDLVRQAYKEAVEVEASKERPNTRPVPYIPR